MWFLEKEVNICAAHHLRNYSGVCRRQHGHNWKIVVYCKGNQLDKVGMLVDFVTIKETIMKYDHRDINTLIKENPTAENLAKVIFHQIPYCYKVMVEETNGSKIYYTDEE